MQTSKWGPPTWKAFHAIAHNYNPGIHDKSDYINFYKTLGKVLPCKYCRESYTQFFSEIPITDYMSCQRDMTMWAYLMHNKVNDKLRAQGLLKTPNPPFEAIYNRYEQWSADCASRPGKPDTCRMPEMENRCKANTKRGKQCSRFQVAGSKLCQQHKIQARYPGIVKKKDRKRNSKLRSRSKPISRRRSRSKK